MTILFTHPQTVTPPFKAALALTLRTTTILLGTTPLVYGAMPEWFAVFKQVDWKAVHVKG